MGVGVIEDRAVSVDVVEVAEVAGDGKLKSANDLKSAVKRTCRLGEFFLRNMKECNRHTE